MRLLRSIITLPILVIGMLSSAQTIRLELSHGAEDDLFQKSQAIVPVYKYVSDSIEEYSKFGLEGVELKWFQIKKLPDMSACRDTGYTYIYFAGADNDRSKSYILTLVGNYARSRRDVLFWIDRNNDLDLTNDGPPDTLSPQDFDFTLRLHNITDSTSYYGIKLSRFKYNENIQYKRLVEQHYRSHSGSKLFTKVNYSYREQRYNTSSGQYRSGRDSFQFALKDMDANAFYNDAVSDKFYVGPYGSQVQSDLLIDLSKKDNGFEWNGKYYRITHIDRAGYYVELEVDSTVAIKNKLKLGRSTPNFEYINILNETRELKEFKRKHVYLYFWQLSTLSDEDVSYLEKISKEFQEKIEVLALNHGDDPKQVRMANHFEQYAFPVAYSSQDIAELYKLEDVPRGYYLGKYCKLKNDRISPKELYTLLTVEAEKK